MLGRVTTKSPSLYETEGLKRGFGEEGFMDDFWDASIKADNERFDAAFIGFVTSSFFAIRECHHPQRPR